VIFKGQLVINHDKFVATFDGARDRDSVWMQMLWCTVGLAGKTSSSVLVGGDGLSSMSICQRDSLRFVLNLNRCWWSGWKKKRLFSVHYVC